MSINLDEHPFLFSTTTRLAYNIDNDYYDGKHYVWVALRFDDLDNQAASSNPLSIAADYVKGVMTMDRHSFSILANIAGVTNGAKQMKTLKRINNKKMKEIIAEINRAKFEDFMPMVYVIDSRKVATRIIEVPPAETARSLSPEYKITDLQEDEYELIDFSEIVKINRKIKSGKVR